MSLNRTSILWAAAVSLGAHSLLGGLLLFSPGPFSLSPPEGTAVCFEISLSDGPPEAKADPEPDVKSGAAAARKDTTAARAAKRVRPETLAPADPGREEGTRSVVLASLGTLSDLVPKEMPSVAGEAGPNARKDAGTAVRTDHPESPALLAAPRYRETARPDYPWIARIRGHEGTVLIAAEVLASGSVGRAAVKKSSGFAPLDESALKTVRKWTFDPGKKSGSPETMWVDIPVRFVLHE